jgi:hypothetical protein
MKIELREILNQINSFSAYSPETFPVYIKLVNQSCEMIATFNADEKNPMLSAWINLGLEELNKELQTRLNDQFASLSPDKQKTEFMYSRSTVSMALTNIIMNL